MAGNLVFMRKEKNRINQYSEELSKAIISAQREENNNLRKLIRMNNEPYQNSEFLKLIQTVHDVIQDGSNETIYILPQKQDIPIKVVIDNVDIENNNDGTFIINQKIYPEEMYKVDGKFYMKWHGEWYEIEGEKI